MPLCKELNFTLHIKNMKRLFERVSSYKSVCGSSSIHEANRHANTLINWIKNLEFYEGKDFEFEMLDWESHVGGTLKRFSPSQEYVDNYFNSICKEAEEFLISSVNVKENNGSTIK